MNYEVLPTSSAAGRIISANLGKAVIENPGCPDASLVWLRGKSAMVEKTERLVILMFSECDDDVGFMLIVRPWFRYPSRA